MRRDRGLLKRVAFAGVVAVVAWPALPGAVSPALAQGKAGAPGGKAGQAAGAPAITDDNRDLAKASHEKGRAAEAAGRWQDAYEEYRAAAALVPDPVFEAALGGAALGLGKHREAAQVLARVLGNPAARKALSAAQLSAAEKALSAAREKVGALRVEGPAGAEVWVDGVLIGALPSKEDLFVDAGERDVEARRGGAAVARVHVSVAAGKTEPVKLVEGEGLAPAPVASVAPAAPTAAASAPVAPTAAPSAGPPAGPVSPGGPAPGGGGPGWGPVIALGAVGVAGIAAGTGLWVAAAGQAADARSKYDALPSLPPGPCTTPACQAVHDSLSAQAGLEAGALVAWGVGAAALVGAGVVFFLTDRPAPAAPGRVSVRVAPVIAGSSQGVLVQGAW